jgi:protein-tyrosine phosphatase
MIPLVDMHVHLLAGLDDGPRTWEDALAMCRLAYEEGTRLAAATAHQNEQWGSVTPGRIREAAQQLTRLLEQAGIALTVFASAEVMAHPDLDLSWAQGGLLSVGDGGRYILVEMPHRLFVDLRPLVRRLRTAGLRLILAHPERHPELLHEAGIIEDLIRHGCLVQVSSSSITEGSCRADTRALKSWFRRSCVHLLGSDGHSPRRRPPRMAEAYRQVCRWVGGAAAERIGCANGRTILQGLPLRVPTPEPKRSSWLARLWG